MQLVLDDGQTIVFHAEWIQHLRVISYEQFGEYIRKTVYPAFSEQEKKIWNNSKISNRELLHAVYDVH